MCLISELKGLVIGENSLFPWTCLPRHVCALMTIDNYTASRDLKIFKVLVEGECSQAFCLASTGLSVTEVASCPTSTAEGG